MSGNGLGNNAGQFRKYGRSITVAVVDCQPRRRTERLINEMQEHQQTHLRTTRYRNWWRS